MGVQAKKRLFGDYYVVPTATAIRHAQKLFKNRDAPFYELRRQTLKLAHFPTGTRDGRVVDMDWDWIDGTGARDIGELRVSDVIGGYDNLRVIFFVADKILPGEPLPRIWVINTIQKKTRRFSSHQLNIFANHKKLITLRSYSHSRRGS